MEKKLYLEKPFLYGRLHIGYPMISIMQHQNGKEFLYNYFLNLECHKSNRDLNLCYVSQVDRKSISWINYLNEYRLENINDKKNIVDIFCTEINNNKYIYTKFDDYYLPEKLAIKRHYIHDNMIYGYDDIKKVFYTYGYDLNGKLRSIELPFEAAVDGFKIPGFIEIYSPDLKKNFDFNKEHFKIQIEDFLNSRNTLISDAAWEKCGFSKKDFYYVADVYKRIFEYIKEIPQNGLDIRNTYMIYEWSKLNYIRMVFLKNSKYYLISNILIKDAKDIYYKSKANHYLALKYGIVKDENLLVKIKDNIIWHRNNMLKFYEKLGKIIE